MKKKILIMLCLSVMCFNSAHASSAEDFLDDSEIQEALAEFNSDYTDYNAVISAYQSDAYDFAANITDEGIEDLKNEIEKEIAEAQENNQTEKVKVLEEYLEDISSGGDNFQTDYENLNSEAVSGDEEQIMDEIKNSIIENTAGEK